MKHAVKRMMNSLQGEKINTWFDLGLFLDRLKDKPSSAGFSGSYDDFKQQVNNGGIGFVTFYYAIDGITNELEKYTSALKKILPEVPVYFVGGEVRSEAWNSNDPNIDAGIFPEIQSFDHWQLYQDFFKTKLERGSKEYNALIVKFWEEVLLLTEIIGRCIEQNDIQLLFVVNVCSNPGNVAFALATVLAAEYMGVPVINNSHDYYWEGGNSPADIKYKKLKPGPRDLFFTNAHVGEFFSIIEVLFPWESRSWMTVNINSIQDNHVVEGNGHNPANVTELGTALDFSRFKSVPKRESIVALSQVGEILNESIQAIGDLLKKETKSEIGPFLCGKSDIREFDFVNNNIVLFQPTRIIERKCIELNFELVHKLFKHKNFLKKFEENAQLTLSIIISGPIPTGQKAYFLFLLQRFSELLSKLPNEYQKRVFLGFLFSEFDRPEFKRRHKHPVKMPDLYNAASLVLLPSETEGRGLSIIEAAAAGKPIFCRRYEPQEVYSEVIGEHLEESLRLRVLEFSGEKIPKNLVKIIIDKIFYPQDSMEDVIHNERVVKIRFKLTNLQKNVDHILYRLYLQLISIPDQNRNIANYFEEYRKSFHLKNQDLPAVINQNSRHYLPGYGRLGFMIFLKSLIDPSFFRVEEQQIKGLIMLYTQRMYRANPDRKKVSLENYHQLFNTIDDIFNYPEGEITVRHDHSLAYRHRNKKKYPYRSYTYHELTGLVNLIFQDIIHPPERPIQELSTHVFFNDWNLALVQLTNSHYLGIDDRKMLFQKLKQKIPRAYFPGRYIKYEMEFFVLQPIRAILNLDIEEALTDEMLQKNLELLPEVYIFIHENHVLKRYSTAYVSHYLKYTQDHELKLLFKRGVVKIVKTKQLCIGFHLLQMGAQALKVLRVIKEQNGFLITNGQNSAMMTDILDIDHFHIGQVKGILTSRIMGIPIGSGFVQFVPAGVRTTLAYPTPIQTAKDFDKVIKSKNFRKLEATLGEEKIRDLLRKDAEENGTPVKSFLANLERSLKQKSGRSGIVHTYVGGVYEDGLPWSGVMAKINTQTSPKKWIFVVHTANHAPRSVPELVKEYQKENGKKPQVAWNGGYILNPELVGKLGLPETYIGSPLGLLIMNKQVVSPPLFNKPAFIIYKSGKTDIQRVNCSRGFVISNGKRRLEFNKNNYNIQSSGLPSYYDLLYPQAFLPCDGNMIVRLAGNVIKEIVPGGKNKEIPIIPVGLTLSIPQEQFDPQLFQEERELDIELLSDQSDDIIWNEIAHAVEAGPGLVSNREISIDMVAEGWKTDHSINTQAARLDFTDMRGPKIAVGLTKQGEIIVLMVNGRIRESVGATHQDMGEILISYGAHKAMGFDPGGSSTLVVDGKLLNISPYNSLYEKDIYSLPPEPRFVSNAILGWQQ
ncbi:MAG: phosphodiester glycosidase family protein [Cyclobacteriaceae bacterium]